MNPASNRARVNHTIPWALARHDLVRHLVLPGLAYSKPSLTHWACSRQAQAALDGALSRVWPLPYPQIYTSQFCRSKGLLIRGVGAHDAHPGVQVRGDGLEPFQFNSSCQEA